MTIFSSLFAGILAAFSPCVIVLIPLLLFRFVNQEKFPWKKLLALIAGFLISYIIFAYFLSSIFTSSVQNGVKLGLGIMFIVLGILSILGRINSFNFPLIKNSFLLGLFFALIISFNPCTIPFLSIVVALNANALILIHLSFFGLGLLIPTILFTIFGQNFLNLAKKSRKVIVLIDKLMNLILIISGIYLIILVKGLYQLDMYVALIFLLSVFIILLKSFFVLNSQKDIFKLNNILLLISLILIIVSVGIHCRNKLDYSFHQNLQKDYFSYDLSQGNHQHNTCALSGEKNCQTCYNCMFIFFGALLIGVLGIIINKKIGKLNFGKKNLDIKLREKK